MAEALRLKWIVLFPIFEAFAHVLHHLKSGLRRTRGNQVDLRELRALVGRGFSPAFTDIPRHPLDCSRS